jgi:hypothetical protein
MAIEKLSEFAKDGQKNTDDLNLTDGFPVSKKPARQWFNWLFNSLTSKVNEIIDAEFIPKAEIVDNLTTNDADKVASARTVKQLQDNKLEASDLKDATTEEKGVVQLNNTLTSTATNQALTAAKGKELNDKMFGVGQSWQNVTSSRLNNTTYQNTTSRLIFISITLRDGGGYIELLIDGQRAIYLADIGDLEYQFTAVVGAGASYRLNTTNPLKHWSEYR